MGALSIFCLAIAPQHRDEEPAYKAAPNTENDLIGASK